VGFGLFFKIIFILFISVGTIQAKEKVPVNFLLPLNHPIKPSLDYLFSLTRATLNLDTMKKAGFEVCGPRKFTNLVIAKHPAIPGYIFKLYLDAQRYHKNKSEEHFWVLRIEGALKIRNLIESYGLQCYLKVPQKWIYKLPNKSSVQKGYFRKDYILVEEDMNLFSDEETEMLWKSPAVSHDLLNALVLVLSHVGLSDCVKPDNIPFSKDFKVAFIDTQTHGEHVSLKEFKSYLSEENQAYWDLITHAY
jgi:hypothetical protein